jgi:hypothetical protein
MGPLSNIWKAASNAGSTAAPDHLSLLSSQFKPLQLDGRTFDFRHRSCVGDES